MSDPERLLDGPLPDDVAQLLRSSVEEAHPASKARKQAILAAIAAAPVAPEPLRPRAPLPLRNVLWVGLAALAITAGGLGARGLAPRVAAVPPVNPSPTNTNTTEAAPLLAVAGGPSVADSSRAVPSMSVHELPGAPGTPAPLPRAPSVEASAAPSPSLPPVVAASSATVSAPPRVEDELRAIDATRSALAAGQPASALDHVGRYRTTFPTPHFADEADALEVQALAALGRIPEARTKAEAFALAHPRSPYTQRVRSAVGAADRAP